MVGYTRIPVEPSIMDLLSEYGFEKYYAEKCIDANKHNHVTTTYYLLLKKAGKSD